MKPHRIRRALAIAALSSFACLASAQTYSGVSIASTDNLSGAGSPVSTTPHPGGGSGGTAAASYALSPGTGRTLKMTSVTGTLSMSPGVSTVPDGVLQSTGAAAFGLAMNVNAYGSVSGIALSKGSGFLAGVFLGVAYPASAPASLAFGNANGSGGTATSFAGLSPLIGQIFFIGDGLTGNGTGAQQAFNVPNGATRLFLGVTDASGYVGAPGQFQDNSGSLRASFQVVPEPSSMVALALGGLAVCRRRRSRQGHQGHLGAHDEVEGDRGHRRRPFGS